MNSLIVSVNAVVPFLIYISFGYFVRRIGWADEALLKKMNHMVFKAFFPIMMFYNMYSKDRGISLDLRLVAMALGSLGVLVLVLLFIIPKFVSESKKQGVVIQALYRSNFVLFALPLVNSVYGTKGNAIATMLIAIVVPVYNIIAVFILQYYGNREKSMRVVDLIKGVLTNPLIVGTLIGFAFYILQIPLPSCVEKPISQFAGLTTPLALFILGGTLKMNSMISNIKYILSGLFFKLLVFPFIAVVVCKMLSFGAIETFLIFCMYGTPVATSSYAMAENMGCDGDLAGEFVVISTALSVVTIFMWVFILDYMKVL